MLFDSNSNADHNSAYLTQNKQAKTRSRLETANFGFKPSFAFYITQQNLIITVF